MFEQKVTIDGNRVLNILLNDKPTSACTLFLFHGLGGRSAQWNEQINVLKDQYRLVVPDLYGQGKSEKPHGNANYSFQQFTNDMQTIFNKFAGEKNIIIGHSYGGALSTYLALQNQQRIQKLCLIAPTALAPYKKIPPIYYLPSCILEWLRPALEKGFAKVAFDASARQELINTEIAAGRNNPLYIIKAVMQGMKQMPVTDISMINIPSLILMGKSDQITTVDQIQSFYRKLSQASFQTIINAGHMLMLEKPQEVNNALLQFIQY